jgi:glucokinase
VNGNARLRLVADIGGTNARFATSSSQGQFDNLRALRVGDYSGIAEALEAYRSEVDLTAPFDEAFVAAAGPVERDAIRMTNCPWVVRVEDLDGALAPEAPVALFNDLEAVGLALPHLVPGGVDVVRAGGEAGFPPVRLAVNVGTGFGAAAAHPARSGWEVSATEAGHMTFAARTEEEWALTQKFASVEDVLSGPGFARLYAHLREDEEWAGGPGEVFDRLGTDKSAQAALAFFSTYLGRVAGDLALAHSAGGGIFLCGGLAARWHQAADLDPFFAAFDAKGAMTSRLRAIPIYRITQSEPALFGLSHAQSV